MNKQQTIQEKKLIAELILEYATVYEKFEQCQKDYPSLLQKGDQKTGVIGEYYALLYARKHHRSERVTLCKNPSEKGIDIEVKNDSQTSFIQVKTVSKYSAAGKTSKLVKPANISEELIKVYLISLDKFFRPDGFWIIPGNQAPWGKALAVKQIERDSKFTNRVEKTKQVCLDF